MSTITAFLAIAQKEGFNLQRARVAYKTVEARLARIGYHANSFYYIYRIGKKNSQVGEGASTERLRVLVAFSSPDAAIAFAQRNRFRPTPRLHTLHLAHLLAAMLQSPAISALLIAEEHAEIEPDTQIPTIFRLNRTDLLAMLRGV